MSTRPAQRNERTLADPPSPSLPLVVCLERGGLHHMGSSCKTGNSRVRHSVKPSEREYPSLVPAMSNTPSTAAAAAASPPAAAELAELAGLAWKTWASRSRLSRSSAASSESRALCLQTRSARAARGLAGRTPEKNQRRIREESENDRIYCNTRNPHSPQDHFFRRLHCPTITSHDLSSEPHPGMSCSQIPFDLRECNEAAGCGLAYEIRRPPRRQLLLVNSNSNSGFVYGLS